MHGTLDRSTWTAARVEDLRRFIEEKMSASEAALELGITRNAAIGKANRLGLSFDSQTARNVFFRKQRPAKEPRARSPRIVLRKQAKAIPMEPEPDARNLTFQQLQRNDCRYVVTADRPMLFCGQPKADGSSYCAHHHHVCYTPPPARNRDARPR